MLIMVLYMHDIRVKCIHLTAMVCSDCV